MKTHSLYRYFTMIVLALLTSFAMAGSNSDKQHNAVTTMASILMNLNHYPNAKEKEKLQAIAGNSANSAAIQNIAMAIHDMEHRVSAQHKDQLQAIINSGETSSVEKELAEITLGITHYPDSDAKARLKKLESESM